MSRGGEHPWKRSRGNAVSLRSECSSEEHGVELLRQMRDLLRDPPPGALHDVELGAAGAAGGALQVNRLMLALNSAEFLETKGGCQPELAAKLAGASQPALDGIRDLIHFGSASFGQDQAVFFEAFRVVTALRLKEIHEAFCSAALDLMSAVDIVVELASGHNEQLARRLQTMFRSYPDCASGGFFDLAFVKRGSTCAKAHRLVMAAGSEYFRALVQRETSLDTLEINDVSEQVLKAMLEFVYLGSSAIARGHFTALAFQADGWEIMELLRACSRQVLQDEGLAAAVEQDSTHLPHELAVAVAYTLPKAVREDDVAAFIAYVSDPTLATHLARSRYWPDAEFPICKDSDVEVGYWEGERHYDCRSAYGKGGAFPSKSVGKSKGNKSRGKGKGDKIVACPIGTQLEQFIAGKAFFEFLSCPDSLRLPLWSVVMIVESFFLQLTRFHPDHPRRNRRSGILVTSNLAYVPESWPAVQKELVLWLTRWAAAQPAEELMPALAGLGVPPTLHCLARVRSLVRHHKGAHQGNREWKEFWPGLFLHAVEITYGASAITLLRHCKPHMAVGTVLSVGNWRTSRGKPGGEKIQAWVSVHQIFEAAVRVVASCLPASSGEAAANMPVEQLTCNTLLWLLASQELPEDVTMNKAVVKHVLRRWLIRGGSIDGDTVKRLVEMTVAVASMEHLLRFPIESNRSPYALRFTVSAEEAVHRVLSGLEDVVADGI